MAKKVVTTTTLNGAVIDPVNEKKPEPSQSPLEAGKTIDQTAWYPDAARGIVGRIAADAAQQMAKAMPVVTPPPKRWNPQSPEPLTPEGCYVTEVDPFAPRDSKDTTEDDIRKADGLSRWESAQRIWASDTSRPGIRTTTRQLREKERVAVGDIVTLRTGGPLMNVTSAYNVQTIKCVFFKGVDLFEITIPEICLAKHEGPVSFNPANHQ